jgi:hypothetical protein
MSQMNWQPVEGLGADPYGVNPEWLKDLGPEYWKDKTYTPDFIDSIAWALQNNGINASRNQVIFGGVGLALVLVIIIAK